jgi:diguanylate cyclase (GGDEF)-like protein/PAS domain S-box-containing protein
MHKLFARQLAKATRETGEVDLAALGELVAAAYEDSDRDRRRTDQSMASMIEELGDVHQRLIDAFEAIPEGMALFDAEDRYVLWNRRYAETYATGAVPIAVGTTFEAALRAGLAQCDYADAIGREEEWLTDRLARHRQQSSTHEQELSGGRWVRVDEHRTASGGSVGIRVDITDLKKREESFRLLFDDNPIPMWVVESEAQKFLSVNDAAVEYYGYSRDQFLGMTTFDLRPAGDREEFARYIRTGNFSQGTKTWRHLKSDGSPIYVSVYARSMDYQGRPARLNAIIDITAQKQADDEILKQKLQTESAINNMSQGLVMFDADARLVVCNNRYIEMYGFSRDSVKPGCTLTDVFKQQANRGLLVDDADHYEVDLLAALSLGKTIKRVIGTVDGREILITNQPMPNGGWVATHEDITEKKQVEARIAKEASENRRLFETSLDLILVTDDKGTFVRVSPSSMAILGYLPDEMIGRSAAEFIYPDDLDSTRGEMRLARQGLSMRNFETRYIHRLGAVATLAWSGVWSEPEKQYFFTGRDVTDSKLAEEKLRHLAHYDQLTGLRNRTSLQNDLMELLEPPVASGRQPASVAMFDLDGFKNVNDTLGHSIGDQLLQEVAQRMAEFAADNMRFYRLGGDEFVLTLSDCGDPGEIGQIVDFILKRFRDSFDIGGHRLFIGASAGIAITSDGISVEELFLNADLALYDAKAAGGNMYRLFVPTLRAKAVARRELDGEIRRAYADKEFVVYFQPQLRVSDGAVVGAEALLRWQHPERGIIGPGAFIDALAESPVALDVGRWILQTSCDYAAKWRAMGLPPIRVGVNLFPVQFQNELLLKDVDDALRQSGLPPEALELEITENIALGRDDTMIAQLGSLRSDGVHIAFDDFGTGYASLSYLARYPLSRIKIDQSFMRNITAESTAQDTAIVRSLIVMAHNLNLEVIAEGVETADQAAFLKAEKCEEVQGFLYAKALPPQEFEEFLRSNQMRFARVENATTVLAAAG